VRTRARGRALARPRRRDRPGGARLRGQAGRRERAARECGQQRGAGPEREPREREDPCAGQEGQPRERGEEEADPRTPGGQRGEQRETGEDREHGVRSAALRLPGERVRGDGVRGDSQRKGGWTIEAAAQRPSERAHVARGRPRAQPRLDQRGAAVRRHQTAHRGRIRLRASLQPAQIERSDGPLGNQRHERELPSVQHHSPPRSE